MFDWQVQHAWDGSGYGLVQAGPKGIGGGIGPAQDGGPARSPTEVPNFGLTLAPFSDPEGHVVGLSKGAGPVVSEAEENKARSSRLYFEVFGNGNYAAADQLMTADCVSHGAGSPPQIGTEGIKRQAVLLRTAIPDLHVTLNDQVAEGDRVASRWTGSGTHTGPLQFPTGTIAPTGNHISFDEIRIDRHVDRHIAESWFIPDRFTLWQQLGLLPRPGAQPR